MSVQFSWKGAERSDALEDHFVRRSQLSFDRIAARIHRVVVRFEDLHGPRGGVDKVCNIEVFGDFGSRAAEARDADFRTAAERAIEMVTRSTMRFLRRPAELREDSFDTPDDKSESHRHTTR